MRILFGGHGSKWFGGFGGRGCDKGGRDWGGRDWDGHGHRGHRGHDDDGHHWKGKGFGHFGGCKPKWEKVCEKPEPPKCEPEQPEPNNAPQITGPANGTTLVIADAPNAAIVDVDAIDPDGDTLIFSLGGDDADHFVIDEETGVIGTSDLPLLDGSADGDTLSIDVTVTDEFGLTDTIQLEIDVIQVA